MEKQYINKLSIFLSLLFISFFLVSCRSFGLKSVSETDLSPLNFSDEDVLKNEKKRINELLQSEPVEAYWRSIHLGDQEILSQVLNSIDVCIKNALEQKDYFSLWRYTKSLDNTGTSSEIISHEEAEKLFKSSVPGFLPNEKEPLNFNDCVQATVTVLVDKGLVIKNGAGYPEKVIGSGFFIDKRGYIVTNHHVISDMVDSSYEGYSRLYIKLPGNEEDKIPARVIGWDPVIDLALIKAEIEPEFVLSLGSSEKLGVGEKINVIGAPLGLEGSLTSGIISNTKRRLFTTGEVFQIDAPVNSGNSGGPCIDNDRKVQAIVFAGVLQAQGLNFAIPVEYLKQELPFLYAGGEYHHSWTGCYGHTKRINGRKSGVDIQYVMPGSAGRLSGLEAGQVISKINEKSIRTLEEFQNVLMDMSPGTISCITVQDEKKFVYLEKRPENPTLDIYKSDLIQNSFLPLFGLGLSSTSSRNTYKVENVVESTVADEMQFSVNDPVTIKNVKVIEDGKYIVAQITTLRHKKNFSDIAMTLGATFDGPDYF